MNTELITQASSTAVARTHHTLSLRGDGERHSYRPTSRQGKPTLQSLNMKAQDGPLLLYWLIRERSTVREARHWNGHICALSLGVLRRPVRAARTSTLLALRFRTAVQARQIRRTKICSNFKVDFSFIKQRICRFYSTFKETQSF